MKPKANCDFVKQVERCLNEIKLVLNKLVRLKTDGMPVQQEEKGLMT